MPTKAERTALVFIAGVALVGGLVRVARALRGGMRPAPSAVAALEDQRRLVDSAARLDRAVRQPAGRRPISAARRPPSRRKADVAPAAPAPGAPAPKFPVDVDRATTTELEALPRVGPALARRIVAEREAKGPYGDLEALDRRVKGVGPALVAAIRPLVTFSGR